MNKQRKASREKAEQIRLDLIGARAAIVTTMVALRRGGVDEEIATNLQRAALIPIDQALSALEPSR